MQVFLATYGDAKIAAGNSRWSQPRRRVYMRSMRLWVWGLRWVFLCRLKRCSRWEEREAVGRQRWCFRVYCMMIPLGLLIQFGCRLEFSRAR